MKRITAKPAEILPGILTRIAIAKYCTSVAVSVHRLSTRIEQMPYIIEQTLHRIEQTLHRIEQMPYRISNIPPLD